MANILLSERPMIPNHRRSTPRFDHRRLGNQQSRNQYFPASIMSRRAGDNENDLVNSGFSGQEMASWQVWRRLIPSHPNGHHPTVTTKQASPHQLPPASAATSPRQLRNRTPSLHARAPPSAPRSTEAAVGCVNPFACLLMGPLLLSLFLRRPG
ncbi:hypothetical protein VTK26DRAFT_5659 [Humicola hyalothermophila]